MKKNFYKLIQAIISVFLISSFSACNKDINTIQDSNIRGVSIVPNPVEIGEKISINGYNFHNAKSVRFAENITVSSFEKVGKHQLDVVVPPGTVNESNIVVELPDDAYVIPIELKLLSPKVTSTYPLSGTSDVGPGEILVILGTDLINVSEIIFPGNQQAYVKEMDFYRKGNEEIKVVVPFGTEESFAPVILRTKYGFEFESTLIEFSSGGSVPPLYQLLCGKEGLGKTWTWDEGRHEGGIVVGTGTYQKDILPTGNYMNVDNVASNLGQSNGRGAKMFFSYSKSENIMIKTKVDGGTINGYYEIDTSEIKNNLGDGSPWSIGMLNIVGGDPDLTILVNVIIKDFDILELTENKLVLCANYGGIGYYFYFIALDD